VGETHLYSGADDLVGVGESYRGEFARPGGEDVFSVRLIVIPIPSVPPSECQHGQNVAAGTHQFLILRSPSPSLLLE